jgi:hypothetical protein
LEEAGYGLGARMLELCCYREHNSKRETKLIKIVQERCARRLTDVKLCAVSVRALAWV